MGFALPLHRGAGGKSFSISESLLFYFHYRDIYDEIDFKIENLRTEQRTAESYGKQLDKFAFMLVLLFLFSHQPAATLECSYTLWLS